MMNLPPLPEPAVWLSTGGRTKTVLELRRPVTRDDFGPAEEKGDQFFNEWKAAHPSSRHYTEDQLRSYGESCARMAREEAAKIVDEYEFPGIVPHNPEDAEVAECAGEVLRWRLLRPLAAAIRKGA